MSDTSPLNDYVRPSDIVDLLLDCTMSNEWFFSTCCIGWFWAEVYKNRYVDRTSCLEGLLKEVESIRSNVEIYDRSIWADLFTEFLRDGKGKHISVRSYFDGSKYHHDVVLPENSGYIGHMPYTLMFKNHFTEQ